MNWYKKAQTIESAQPNYGPSANSLVPVDTSLPTPATTRPRLPPSPVGAPLVGAHVRATTPRPRLPAAPRTGTPCGCPRGTTTWRARRFQLGQCLPKPMRPAPAVTAPSSSPPRLPRRRPPALTQSPKRLYSPPSSKMLQAFCKSTEGSSPRLSKENVLKCVSRA